MLAALHEITARCRWLPEDELRGAAAELSVPASRMVSAASFYAAFGFGLSRLDMSRESDLSGLGP